MPKYYGITVRDSSPAALRAFLLGFLRAAARMRVHSRAAIRGEDKQKNAATEIKVNKFDRQTERNLLKATSAYRREINVSLSSVRPSVSRFDRVACFVPSAFGVDRILCVFQRPCKPPSRLLSHSPNVCIAYPRLTKYRESTQSRKEKDEGKRGGKAEEICRKERNRES